MSDPATPLLYAASPRGDSPQPASSFPPPPPLPPAASEGASTRGGSIRVAPAGAAAAPTCARATSREPAARAMASAPGDAPAADAASPVALASDAVSEDGDAARRGCGGALRCAANALYRHRGKPNEVFGWYFHAAARAPFLFAVAAFLAPYLTALAQFEQAADGRVSWLGLRLLPSSFVAVFTTVANLLMALVMPLLGTAADFTAYRKLLLAGFNTVGALCGVLMLVVTRELWWLGGLLFIAAAFCYEATLAFLYSYLPEVAPRPRKRSKVSAQALCWANTSQVLFALALVGLVLVTTTPRVDVRNASFERPDVSAWSLRVFNGSDPASLIATLPCPQTAATPNATHLCERVGEDSTRGSHSLRVVINATALPSPSAAIALSQTSAEHTDRFRGQTLFLQARARVRGGGGFRVRLVGGETQAASALSTPDADRFASRHVVARVDDTATALDMQPALLLGADVSEALVDDVQLLSLPSRMLAACVAIVSVWWGALNVVTLRNLRPRPASQERPPGVSLLAAAASQLRATLAAAVAPANANAFRFLVALLFSSAGNAAVLAVTPAVLVDEIRLTSAQVSVVLLCVQLAGIAGAALYHRLGACAGLRAAYALVLLQWLLGPQAIFLLETEDDLPLVLGVGVYLGVALGGYIALGRALYAGLLVRGKEAQFMGLFVFATQLLSWLGTLTFTVINESTRNVRFAYAFLSVFFAIALLLFSRVRAPDPPAQVEPDAPIEPRRVGAEEDEEQPEDDPKGKAVELAASKA